MKELTEEEKEYIARCKKKLEERGFDKKEIGISIDETPIKIIYTD